MDEEKTREIAIRILEKVEERLEEKNVLVPSNDRERRPEEARLYSSEYYALEDAVVDIPTDGAGTGGKRVVVGPGMESKAAARRCSGGMRI